MSYNRSKKIIEPYSFFDNISINNIKFNNKYVPSEITGEQSGISNDLIDYNSLVIAGNKSKGGARQVLLMDDLTVDNNLTVKGYSKIDGYSLITGNNIVGGDSNISKNLIVGENINVNKNLNVGNTLNVVKGIQSPLILTDSIGTQNMSAPVNFGSGIQFAGMTFLGHQAIKNPAIIEANSEILSISGPIDDSNNQIINMNGTINVNKNLDVGKLRVSNTYTGYPDVKSDASEITNDPINQKKLMIIGNKSSGTRSVGIWDNLSVGSNLTIGNNLCIGNTCFNEDTLKKIINNIKT